MPFITQGKTNWKFLLIVFILAAIVDGGALWCITKQKVPPPQLPEIKKPEVKTPEEIGLDYKNILKQIFNTYYIRKDEGFSPITELVKVEGSEKCFQNKEKEYLYYCVDNVVEDFFIENYEKNTLFIISYGYSLEKERAIFPHAGIIYHFVLAVFDKKTNKILTKPIELVADELTGGGINFYHCNNKPYILFTGWGGGQGYCIGYTELYKIENNEFKKIWPPENEDWLNMIVEPEGNKLMIYRAQENQSEIDNYSTKYFGGCDSPPFIYSYDLYWNSTKCEFEGME